jgi:hypothetical protein
MQIQFTLPSEYVDAAKDMIRLVNPSNTTPTDDDVVAYVGKALLSGLLGLFPGVVLASQIQHTADLAALQTTIQTGISSAMNITKVV